MKTIDEKARDADLQVVLDGLERSTELSQAEIMEHFDTLSDEVLKEVRNAINNLDCALYAHDIKNGLTGVPIEDLEDWDYGHYSMLAEVILDEQIEAFWDCHEDSIEGMIDEINEHIEKEVENE